MLAAQALIAVLLTASVTCAGAQTGGAPTSASASPTTAAQAAQAQDDTSVVLEGMLVRQIRGDRYEFRDASGTITVEIEDEDWPNRQPVLEKRLRLHGEVERKRIRRVVEVEVTRVELLN